MKITKERLRQVIKEELESVLREASPRTRTRSGLRQHRRRDDRETASAERETSLIQKITNRAYDRLNGRAKDPETGEPVPPTQEDIKWINVDRIGKGLKPIEPPEEQEQSP